jgi:hypothetical protein
VKPIKFRSFSFMLASLVGLTLACQLVDAGKRESKSSTDTSRTAALSAPMPPEPLAVAENTTAAAREQDTTAVPVPCAATEFNYPAVKAACAEGGRSAVKKIMSGAIARAKRADTELQCSHCHVDQKTFGLRPNAVDDLASWL